MHDGCNILNLKYVLHGIGWCQTCDEKLSEIASIIVTDMFRFHHGPLGYELSLSRVCYRLSKWMRIV